ncbi:ribosomal maturation YjgA family protein [Microbacterium phyllosphaerae]
MQPSPDRDATVRTRRRRLLIAAALVIVIGLAVHLIGSGPVADFAGDALYAVMIYLVIATVFARARSWVVGTAAIVVCTLIEVFQLTGLPGVWAEAFWPVRLVLGAGFDARDLIAYAVGAIAATVWDPAARRRALPGRG